MIKTLIIGKDSNLSKHLGKEIKNIILISSRELTTHSNLLATYKDTTINLMFNNYHPSTQLNNISNVEEYIINSIQTTSKILELTISNNITINKIIYTSSSSVYGDNILCNEKDKLEPTNLHASLKVSNEKLIEYFCSKNGIDYTITRIFNMYGGDDKFSVISKIINAAKNSKELTIVNNGNAIRDFIHINDVVKIYTKLLHIKNLKIINIGTGTGSSIKNILLFLTHNNYHIKYKSIEKKELKISTADTKQLQEVLNNDTFINLEDYLKKELSYT